MFVKDFLNEEAIYELNKMKEIEQEINRVDLMYKSGWKSKTYDNLGIKHTLNNLQNQ